MTGWKLTGVKKINEMNMNVEPENQKKMKKSCKTQSGFGAFFDL